MIRTDVRVLFSFNLRFPGQYYDVETGTNYNYFRDYDPATGRYVESDPIGLAGGSASTYTYVGEDPIFSIDPLGLAGHHVFPQANYRNYSDAAKDVFDKSTIATKGRHGWSKAHSAYNAATRELSQNYCRASDVSPEKMTAEQAKDLLRLIEESRDPRIRDFLEAETGLDKFQSGFVSPQAIQEMSAWALFITLLTHSQSAY
jgi:RHS repeat-associated protein